MSDEFQENPAPTDCPECCEKIETETANVKIVRTCAASEPSDVVAAAEGAPITENTYNCTTSLVALPADDTASFNITVANSQVYKMNQWIEFFSSDTTTVVGATYQIIGIPTDTELTLSPLLDGIAIEDNPKNPISIPSGSCFIVCDRPIAPETDADFDSDLYDSVSRATGFCLDSIPTQASSSMRIVVAADSDSNCADCGEPGAPDGSRFCLNKSNADAPLVQGDTFNFTATTTLSASASGFRLGFRDGATGLFEWTANETDVGVAKEYKIVTDFNGVPNIEEADPERSWYLNTREMLLGGNGTSANAFTSKNNGDSDTLNFNATVPDGATHARILIAVSNNRSESIFYVKDDDGKQLMKCLHTDAAGASKGAVNEAIVPMNVGAKSIMLNYSLIASKTPWAAIAAVGSEVSVEHIGFERPNIV